MWQTTLKVQETAEKPPGAVAADAITHRRSGDWTEARFAGHLRRRRAPSSHRLQDFKNSEKSSEKSSEIWQKASAYASERRMLPKINTQLRRSSRCLHTTCPVYQQKQLPRPPATASRSKTISRTQKVEHHESQEAQEAPVREPPLQGMYENVAAQE